MRYLSLLLFFGLSLSGFAQNWTLEQCIQHALEHNTTINQSQKQLEISANNNQQNKWNRLPSINASANHNYNIGRSIDPWTNTFSSQTIQSNAVSLSASWVLYSGNRINNNIKLSDLEVQASQKGLELSQNQVSLTIATSFLQLIVAKENLSIAQRQVELSIAQVERVEKLVEAGQDNKGALLNIQAQLSNDKIQLVSAQNQLNLSQLMLKNLLQLSPTQAFDISYPKFNPSNDIDIPDLNYLLEVASQTLPEVQQAELRIQQSQINERIAKATLIPSLSAYGNLNTVYSESGFETIQDGFEFATIGYTKNNQEPVLRSVPITSIVQKPFKDQLQDNFGQSIGLSLSIPVFNNMRNSTSIANAELNTEITELSLAQVKNQLSTDVATALNSLKAAQSSYQAAVVNEEAQRTNFEYNQKRFDAGLMNATDLLLAKNRWNQAQQQLTSAKYELVFRQLIIEFYKGNPLSLN